MQSPPKLFLRFFRWFCHPLLAKPIEGDLMELYEERVLEFGKRKADLKFIKDVLLLFRKDIIKPSDGTYRINTYGMFKNYFKVGIRNILKYKMFSFINVFGLAVAMSVCMLIILMLADQRSFDRFHSENDRIYRVLGTPVIGSWPYATIPMPLAETLKEEYPIVEDAIYLRRGIGGDASFNQKTVELKGYFTTSSFFEIFSFPLIEGDKSSALSSPNSIVISKEKAYQLFNDKNPIGKQIKFEDRGLHILDIESGKPSVDWGTYTVTGVIDLSSYKTHLTFDALVSSTTLQQLYTDSLIANVSENWEYYWAAYTYLKVKEGTTQNQLEIALTDLSNRKYSDSEELADYQFSSQNLSKITPGIPVNNEPSFRLPEIAYYILSILALVIMIMACLNYTNLSIARSLTRMKEIGVRKVNGATRKNLIFQFLTESVITVLIALVVAYVVLYFTKEAFMSLWFNKYFNFELSTSLSVIFKFLVFALAIGLVAGTYPALFLSKKNPINALKNTNISKGKWGLQKVLNVSQFVVSLIFIVTSMVIYNQFKHYTEFEYGFNSENIINIPLQSNDYDLVVNEFSQVSGVTSISAVDYIPATGISNVIELASSKEDDEPFVLLNFYVDEHFIDNLNLKLLHGQPITSSREDGKYIVINESAVEKLGYENPQSAIGQIWELENGESSVQIIGVVENFRATLLINGHEIRPMALSNSKSNLNYLNVRIAEGNPLKTVADLEARWKQLDPIHEFKYDFYDQELANTNLAIFDVVTIVGYISFLAILIACLGLLGMATYVTERKTKEVGIRKVLGAEDFKIVLILSKSFLKLLIISILIAAPLSYFVNSLWLNDLPNRVELGFGTVIIGSLLMLGLGLLTIGSQTLRAARQNPVETLKDE
ncbi:ABC transporter permease [Ekhidna sp.]|uniref:ABC transporter permease n=1 Tax=Ekhidna sp. TaxID=2608089 RepID=UPI003297971C